MEATGKKKKKDSESLVLLLHGMQEKVRKSRDYFPDDNHPIQKGQVLANHNIKNSSFVCDPEHVKRYLAEVV